LSLARGNAHSSSFSFIFSAAGLINKANTLLWTNKAVYLFGEMKGETSAENLLLASRIDWLHTARLCTYYELQGLRDRFKNYSSRILPAVGLGYKVMARDTVTLGLDAGLSQVFTTYYDSGDSESFTALKFGEQLVWKIAAASEFNEKLEYEPDVSDFGRSLIRGEANLIAALVKSWSLKLTFIDTYDSRPVGLGIKENDIAFSGSVDWKF
jgi:putative salt-induced outer membrane protein YdiY